MKQYLVLLLILLAACTAAPQEDVFRIGFIGPLTGEMASLGNDWQSTVEMAVNEINAAGGVNGVPVEVVYEDGRCTSKDAVAAYRSLTTTREIDAIIAYCSPEVLGIAPIAETDNILIISPSATAPDITTAGDHVFRIAPSDALQGEAGAQLMVDKAAERIAVLYINNDYGVGLKNSLESALGDKVILTESFETEGGANDVRSQLSKIKNADVDALYLASFPKPASYVLEQANELGLEMQIYGPEGLKGDEVLSVAEGVLFTAPSSEGEQHGAFVNRHVEAVGGQPSLFSGETYDSIYLLAEAFANNPEDPVAGMQMVTSYDGVAGYVEFDENGDVSKPYDVFTVENEEFVKIDTVSLS